MERAQHGQASQTTSTTTKSIDIAMAEIPPPIITDGPSPEPIQNEPTSSVPIHIGALSAESPIPNIQLTKIQMQKLSKSDIIDSYPWMLLFKNQYFYSRIIMILLSIFITIVCIFYAIGQRLSLILDNYWCHTTTIEDIRQHSIDNELPHGERDSCWAIKQTAVSLDICFFVFLYFPYLCFLFVLLYIFLSLF